MGPTVTGTVVDGDDSDGNEAVVDDSGWDPGPVVDEGWQPAVERDGVWPPPLIVCCTWPYVGCQNLLAAHLMANF